MRSLWQSRALNPKKAPLPPLFPYHSRDHQGLVWSSQDDLRLAPSVSRRSLRDRRGCASVFVLVLTDPATS
jgi:hypothetical protein